MEMMMPKHAKEDKPSKFAWAKVDPVEEKYLAEEFAEKMKTATQTVKISYDPPKDEFYKERIKTLEKRIAELEAELNEAKRDAAAMTSLYESGAESLSRNEARSDEIIARKNEEIQMAKEAIYLAAMREVALR